MQEIQNHGGGDGGVIIWLEHHLEAVITGSLTALGAIIVHMKAVGTIQATIIALQESSKENRAEIQELSKRLTTHLVFSRRSHKDVQSIANALGIPVQSEGSDDEL